MQSLYFLSNFLNFLFTCSIKGHEYPRRGFCALVHSFQEHRASGQRNNHIDGFVKQYLDFITGDFLEIAALESYGVESKRTNL